MTTVGIIGGGQLGRMLALAGYPMQFRFRVLESKADCPAGDVAEVVVGAYDDSAALARLAKGARVATYEFENVPAEAVERLSDLVPVYPPVEALRIAQDRLLEKQTFEALGIPTTRFSSISSVEDLRAAMKRIGLPAVLKTRRQGYDGKGQRVLSDYGEATPAWDSLRNVPAILEEFIPFDREVAIVAARGIDGETALYPLVETRQRHGMLAVAIAPAPQGSPLLEEQARRYARLLLGRLNYVGVMALEMFEHNGRLIANEIAPRVHNSGHWTIEGAETSQFANHLRAILGLRLGCTDAVGCSALFNLIGTLPPLEELAAIPHARIHLYGKTPRAGRKLGHVTIRAADGDTLTRRMAELQTLIEQSINDPSDVVPE